MTGPDSATALDPKVYGPWTATMLMSASSDGQARWRVPTTWPDALRPSVGDHLDDGRFRHDAPTPDGVPGERVLTAEVENPTVTQLDGKGDGVPEGVVTEHESLVGGTRRSPRLAPAWCHNGVGVGVDRTRRR